MQNSLSKDLFVNVYETEARRFQVSNWAMKEKGKNQIPVIGNGEKMQMTVCLVVSDAGRQLGKNSEIKAKQTPPIQV